MTEKVKNEETKTETPKQSSGTGLEPNVAALLAYLFDVVGGLIFFLIEKENKFVRFAGAQSMVLGLVNLGIVWLVLPLLTGLTLGFGIIVYPIYTIAYVVLRILLMVKAYQNQEWELPVIGKLSRNFLK